MTKPQECSRCSTPLDSDHDSDSADDVLLCDDCADSADEPVPPAEASIFAAIESTSRKKKKKRKAAKKSKAEDGTTGTAAAPGRDVETRPDLHLEIDASKWSRRFFFWRKKDETARRVRELLNGRSVGEPLLFRPWPYRGTWLRFILVSLASSLIFSALLALYVRRPEFAFSGSFDAPFFALLALTVIGPITILYWPLYRRYFRFQRGYDLGDYLFPSGYINARSEEVTVQAWESATASEPDGSEDEFNTFDIHTAGGDALGLKPDFRGDLGRAAEAITEFDGTTTNGGLKDLQDEYTEPMGFGPADSTFSGFFARLGTSVLSATFFLTIPLALILQITIQPSRLETTLEQYDEMVAALLEHDAEAHKTFLKFDDLCEKYGERPGQAVRRLNEEVCDDIEKTRVLATFEPGRIHQILDWPDVAHRDLLVERIERYYEQRRSNIPPLDNDNSTGYTRLADHLLRLAGENKTSEFGITIRPVISPRFEDYEKLTEMAKTDGSIPADSRAVLDEFGVPDYYQTADSDGDYQSALSFIRGRHGVEGTLSMDRKIEEVVNSIFSHEEMEIERETDRPVYMYSSATFDFENDTPNSRDLALLRQDLKRFADFLYGIGDLRPRQYAEVARDSDDIDDGKLLFGSAPDDDHAAVLDTLRAESALGDIGDIGSLGELEGVSFQDSHNNSDRIGDLLGGSNANRNSNRRRDPGPIRRDDRFLEEFLSTSPYTTRPTIVVTVFATPGDDVYRANGDAVSSVHIRIFVQWAESFGAKDELFELGADAPSSFEFPDDVDPEKPEELYKSIVDEASQRLEKSLQDEFAPVWELLNSDE